MIPPIASASLILVFFGLIFFTVFKFFKKPKKAPPIPVKKSSPIKPIPPVASKDPNADQLMKTGQYDRAMVFFEKNGDFQRAAEAAVLKKDLERAAVYFEKAGELSKAANIYFDLKKYPKAEQILELLGKSAELGDIYKRRGETILAAKAYLAIEAYDKASLLLEEGGHLLEAADAAHEAYEEAKQNILSNTMDPYSQKTKLLGVRTAQLFKKTGQLKRASKLYLELQMHQDAALSAVELKDYQRAAEIFEMIGQLDDAQKYWELAGNSSKAVRMAGEKLITDGQTEKAIETFAQVGEYSRAAEVYLEAEQPEKAAEMYEKAGEFSVAASFYKQANKLEKAANCYEQAGDLRLAIECYERANQFDREISLRKQIGDYIGVAKKYYEKGLQKDALSILSKVHDTDMSFKSAQSLKAKIYLSIGDMNQAEECFKKAVHLAKKISSDDLDTIFSLSQMPHRSDAREQALQLLEDFIAKNMIETSVISKAEEIKKSLSSPDNAKTSVSSKKDIARTSRYSPIEEIGRGGMGIVYKAKDRILDRTVALKILPASLKKNARAVHTFLREAKAAASLSHPNIVTVHDTGVQNGDYYIAMEYIDGKTLKDILRTQKKFSLAQSQEILKQLLDGLQYAHGQGVVHRDLTTSNVMLTSYKTIKIMDFGLAKVMKDFLNEQSIIGGTPSFMSPEQTLGKPIDRRTDIYSLGICLFELLLGELPFQKGDLGYHHLHTQPPIPKSLDPKIPDHINQIILKCMEKAPENRYQSVEEIRALLS